MDKPTWQRECQTFEAEFHAHENYRWDRAGFEAAWATHFHDWCDCGLYHSYGRSLDDHVVIDIGCGSRPAIDYFDDSVKFYIDPLVDKYVKIPQVAAVWDPEHIAHTFGMEAEIRLKWLQNTASFINCWNVLDHCYDWRTVFENMVSYARSGCRVSFSTDIAAHTGHAGIDNTEELMAMIHESFNVVKQEPGYWGRHIAMLLEKKERE